jgi:hypothetical protein
LRLEEKRLDEIAREHERLEEMKRRNAKAGPVSKKTLNLKKQVQRYIAEMNRWDDDTFAYGDRKLTVVLNFLRTTLEYDSDDLDPRADGQVRQCLFALRARLHLVRNYYYRAPGDGLKIQLLQGLCDARYCSTIEGPAWRC